MLGLDLNTMAKGWMIKLKAKPAILFYIICITQTKAHCKQWNKKEISDINKMTLLWIQIVVLRIDQSAAAFLPSISFIFWCYLPSSCSYQFISPHISPSSLLSSQIYLSKCVYLCVYVCVCLCVCVCLHAPFVQENVSMWSMVRGKYVCFINCSSETEKWQTVAVNECVYPSVSSCACADTFCFSADQVVSLSKYLLPSRSVSWSNLQPEGPFSVKNQKSGLLGRVMVGGSKPQWLEPSIDGQQEGSHPGNYQRDVLVTNTGEWKRQRDF